MKYLFLLILLLASGSIFAEDANSSDLDAELGLQNEDDDLDEIDKMEVEFVEGRGIRSREIGSAWSISGAVGVSYLYFNFDDTSPSKVSNLGIPVVLNYGYRYHKAIELSILGLTEFSAGVNAASLPLARGTLSNHTFDVWSFPVTLFGQMYFNKVVEFQFGFGSHYWVLFDKYGVSDDDTANRVYNDSGLSYAFTYAFTYHYQIHRGLNALVTLQHYYLPIDVTTKAQFNSADYPLYMLTVGIKYFL